MSKEVRYHLYFLETIVFWIRFKIERSPDEYLQISIDYTNVAVISNFLSRTSPFTPVTHPFAIPYMRITYIDVLLE